MNPLSSQSEASPKGARKRKAALFWLATVAASAAFFVLAILSKTSAFFPIDLQITRSLQIIQSPIFSSLMVAVSWVGFQPQSWLSAAAVTILLFILKLRWEAAMALFCALFTELLNLLVKLIVHRPRPSAGLVHVFASLGSYSFPSGHVMYYTGFFGYVCFLIFILMRPSWKRSLLLAPFAGHILLVGMSRIYMGEHWASDALGAYLLGSLSLAVTIALYRLGRRRNPHWIKN